MNSKNRKVVIGVATFAVVGTVAWLLVWVPFLADRFSK